MSETKESTDFITKQKELYNRNILYIDKIFNPLKSGEPDILSIYKCMPCFMESKKINSLSFKNNHPFSDLQIRNLRIKKQAGAMAIGLLILDQDNIRYIHQEELKKYITKEDWVKAEVFNWEMLRSIWIKRIQINF